MRALHALTARTSFHADAEDEGLLQDEHQHCREQEGGKSALGVVQGHVFVGQGRSGDFFLSLGSARGLRHLDARIGLQCHICGSGQHRFIVEHTAHVAVDLYTHRRSALKIAIHLTGQGDHTISFALAHETLGFCQRISLSHHLHIGSGIEPSHKVARKTTMVAIDYHHWHIAHHFFIINKSVEYRINRWDNEQEDNQSSIGKYVAQSVAKGFMHIDRVREGILSGSELFVFSISVCQNRSEGLQQV